MIKNILCFHKLFTQIYVLYIENKISKGGLE